MKLFCFSLELVFRNLACLDGGEAVRKVPPQGISDDSVTGPVSRRGPLAEMGVRKASLLRSSSAYLVRGALLARQRECVRPGDERDGLVRVFKEGVDAGLRERRSKQQDTQTAFGARTCKENQSWQHDTQYI